MLFTNKNGGRWVALASALVAGALLMAGCGGGGGGGTTGPQYATLSVRSAPAGARVFINGTDTTKTTPAEIQQEVQAAGTQFEVTVRLSGYEDATKTVTATPNQTVTVDFTLQQAQPPVIPPHTITGKVLLQQAGGGTAPATSASVVATSATSGTFTATFDPAQAGDGTYYIFAPAGTYTVTASKSGYQSQTKTVTVLSGDDRKTQDFTLPLP